MKAQILMVTVLLLAGLGGSFDVRCNTNKSAPSKIDAVGNSSEAGIYLDTVKMPEETVNIYVHKLSTDKHSSQFVVFVRKFVPTHIHQHHSESVYVLSGEGEFNLNGKISKISAGHFIYIPEGVVHGVKTTSKEPLKVLSVQAPEFFGKDRVPVPMP